MQIDEVVAFVDHLFRDHIRRAVGLCAGQRPGIEPVHALVVGRVHVRRDPLERRHVDERQQNQRSRHLVRLHAVDQHLDGDDRRVLRAVRARRDGEHRAGARAVDDNDGDVVAGVRAGRHLQHAVRLLPALRGRRASGERRVRVLSGARLDGTGQRENRRREDGFHARNFTTVRASPYSCRLPLRDRDARGVVRRTSGERS